MQYSPRPRRFRKTLAANSRAAGNLTAGQLLTPVVGRDMADRYAAQITKTAQKLGTSANAVTFTKRNGRARATAAYDVERDALNLVLALATYRPSLSATVTKTGKPSNSKAAQAQREAFAAYQRAFNGRTAAAPARVLVAA